MVDLILGKGFVHPPILLEPHIRDSRFVGKGIHNAYYHAIMRFGLIGLLMNLYFYYYPILKSMRDPQSNIFPAAIAVGFLGYMLFESTLFFGVGVTSSMQAIVLGYMLKPRDRECKYKSLT
ncbi:hypothetical protein HWV07_17780 [Natronomonas salina]|nr:hypothetical protein [Natronomonas salina]QLD90793.1 hypothetical protein HWV07_17780 [Natronomonas salina]